MPILFCERCNKETTWVYLGDEAVYCKSCDWTMDAEEFRAYRKRILRGLLEKVLEAKRKKELHPLEELFNEIEHEVRSNPQLAEEVHKRNMKELEKLVNKASRKRRRREYAIGVVPL